MIFRPMLAYIKTPDLAAISYPKLASPKLDGYRCVIVNGQGRSRTLKPFANRYVTETLRGLPHGLDGEVIVGSPNEGDVFNRTGSAIGGFEGEPDFTYWVFDCFDVQAPFAERQLRAKKLIEESGKPWLKLVPQTLVHSADEAWAFAQAQLDAGYEGAMLRDPQGPYKFNRTTLKEEWLLKVKVRDDSEGEIVSVYEMMHNDNEAVTNALGLTKRATKQENMRPADTLGGVTVRWKGGTMFDLAVNGTADYAKRLWADRESLPGQLVSFYHQGVGKNGRPRFAVWKGLRAKEDCEANLS